MDWRSTDNPPGWKEGGDVEMRDMGGKVTKGYITFDVGHNDGGEVPIIELFVDGRQVSFFDFEEWRQHSGERQAA